MCNVELATPCESFDIHQNVHILMVWLGIYKLHSPNPYLRRLHSVYRVIVLLFIFTVNVQRITKICLIIYNAKNSALPLFIEEISEFNFFWKLLTINLNHSKLHDIHSLIKDQIFAAETKREEIYLKQYKSKASRIFRLLLSWVILILIIWMTNLVKSWIEDPTFVGPLYYPFDVRSQHRYKNRSVFNVRIALDKFSQSYSSSHMKSIRAVNRHEYNSSLPDPFFPVGTFGKCPRPRDR
ncbi:unnamed protein product [Chilo suppressalis]|uniref:Odorant receptor n=1 Tax=Chilo suppressalis TaxID=168631 RepID=A0ABN8BGQ6_CHISP|nr:unnamed protein product [Chilo suppressalis]